MLNYQEIKELMESSFQESQLNEGESYHVVHDGVPEGHDAAHLFGPNKERPPRGYFVNTATRYLNSAQRTRDMLKRKGFTNPRILSNGKEVKDES